MVIPLFFKKVVAIAFFSIVMMCGYSAKADSFFEEKVFLFQANKIQRIHLNNQNGLVSVKVSRNVNEFHLKIQKEISGLHDESKARTYLSNAVKENLQLEGQQLNLDFEYPSITIAGTNIKTNVIIEVPAIFVARDWRISTGNGQITVSNLKVGNFTLKVGNGELELIDLGANSLFATVGNGNILFSRGNVTSISNFTVGNGSLKIDQVSSKELKAAVKNGRVTISINKQLSQVDLAVSLGKISSSLPLNIEKFGLGAKGHYQPPQEKLEMELQYIEINVNLGSIYLE
jgi:hypothetical protein